MIKTNDPSLLKAKKANYSFTKMELKALVDALSIDPVYFGPEDAETIYLLSTEPIGAIMRKKLEPVIGSSKNPAQALVIYDAKKLFSNLKTDDKTWVVSTAEPTALQEALQAARDYVTQRSAEMQHAVPQVTLTEDSTDSSGESYKEDTFTEETYRESVQGIFSTEENPQDKKTLEEVEDEIKQSTFGHSESTGSSLDARLAAIKNAQDAMTFMSSTSMQSLISDLKEESVDFHSCEDRVLAITASITATMSDATIPLEERLDKVKVLASDASISTAAGNTLILQSVSKILESISSTVLRSIKTEADKAATVISNLGLQYTGGTAEIVKLADERRGTLLELYAMKEQLFSAAQSLNTLANTAEAEVLERALRVTANDNINQMIKEKVGNFVSPSLGQYIDAMYKQIKDVPVIYEELSASISELIQKVYSLFKQDSDIIKAQKEMLDRINAAGLSQTRMAADLAHKNVCLIIGSQFSGKSITAISMAHHAKAKGYDSVIIDMTDSPNYASYGFKTVTLDEYIKRDIDPLAGIHIVHTKQVREVLQFVEDDKLNATVYVVLEPSAVEEAIALAANARSCYIVWNPVVSKPGEVSAITSTLILPRFVAVVNNSSLPIANVIERAGITDGTIAVSVKHLPLVLDSSLKGINPMNDREVSSCFAILDRYE